MASHAAPRVLSAQDWDSLMAYMRHLVHSSPDDVGRLYGDLLCFFHLLRDFGPRSAGPSSFPDDARLGALRHALDRLEAGHPYSDVLRNSALVALKGPVNAAGLTRTWDKYLNYFFMFIVTHAAQGALKRYFRVPSHNRRQALAQYARIAVDADSLALPERPTTCQEMSAMYKRYYGVEPTDCLEYVGHVKCIVDAYNVAVASKTS